MSKSIKIDDSLYEKLKDFADEECRTVSQTVEYLLKCYESKKNRLAEPKKETKSSQEDTSGRVEVKSYAQLKAEKARIEMEYAEKMNYCQDTDSIRELYAEMNRKLEPIQAQIDAFFNK